MPSPKSISLRRKDRTEKAFHVEVNPGTTTAATVARYTPAEFEMNAQTLDDLSLEAEKLGVPLNLLATEIVANALANREYLCKMAGTVLNKMDRSNEIKQITSILEDLYSLTEEI